MNRSWFKKDHDWVHPQETPDAGIIARTTTLIAFHLHFLIDLNVSGPVWSRRRAVHLPRFDSQSMLADAQIHCRAIILLVLNGK